MQSASSANGEISPLNIQPKLLYSREEAAELLSISVRTVDYMIANKQLTVRRIGKRRLIPYQALLQCTRKDSVGRVQ